MSKKNKLWIIIAASFLAVGLILFAGAMIALDFDFTRLSTVKYETNTLKISEDFSKISIDADTADIEFVPSDNKQCEIVCFEEEKVKHSAAVEDGTLTIAAVDTRKWYDHIGISFVEPKVTVYLPKAEYDELIIKGKTGDIEIPNDFTFDTVDISSKTGNVECHASASELMKIKLSTGDVNVENISAGALDLSVTTGNVTVSSVYCEGDIKVAVSTGRTNLTDVSCRSVISSGSTGNVSLKNVVAAESFSIERSTGNVSFEDSDAAEIYVKTSTGNVKGTLLSEKIFITETSTGRVDVPKTAAGGKCEITTSTGNIQIGIK